MSNTNALGIWSSKWAFILATTGAAVGLGNIWKFPYIAGENGGGAFVLIYLICILFIGIPLMIAEVMIGRRGRQNPDMAMRNVALGSNKSIQWRWVGALTIISSVLILSYYSVIAGWALDYVFLSFAGYFKGANKEQVDLIFNQLIESPWQLSFWHTVVIGTTVLVVSLGIEKGLERTVKYIFPAMLGLLLVIVGYSLDTGFFGHGLTFLFKPNFDKISAQGVLSAVGHAFFTLSLATGSIMMYGAYLPREVSIPKTTLFIAAADTLIALVAGLAIFPIVFAHGLEPGAGPGLIFQTLPLAFGHMPYGDLFASIFFLMLVFAAFTSAISLLEPSVAWLIEYFGASRKKAALIAGTTIWILGFGSVFSFNIGKNVHFLGLNFFEFVDVLTANYMLPVGGLLIAVFTAWKMNREYSYYEFNIESRVVFRTWIYALGILCPFAIAIIFLNIIGMLKI